MKVDVLIKNGRIYDPGSKIDYRGDIAVKDKRIVSLNAGEKPDAGKVLDAHGAYVLPGLIDVHTHCNWLGNYIGMPADLASIPAGVTATIDAGSTGVSNYRAFLRYLDSCEVKSKIMLHASASGQIMSRQFSENIDPSVWDLNLFEKAFRDCGDRIVGIKIRVSKNVVGPLGLKPLEEVVKLADHFGTRLFVHPTDPSGSMADVARLLRAGDVICHMYHGFGNTIQEGERIAEDVLAARKRGVLFDVSQGQGNFSLDLAEKAIAQGFVPDTISTDLNYENWNHPLVFSLPMTMSKMMALGMDFETVVKCVTTRAAEQFGEAGNLGTLAAGSAGDITVVALVDAETTYRDIHGNERRSDKRIVPLATVIDGEVLYRSPETL